MYTPIDKHTHRHTSLIIWNVLINIVTRLKPYLSLLLSLLPPFLSTVLVSSDDSVCYSQYLSFVSQLICFKYFKMKNSFEWEKIAIYH